jgi:hypothetical protein
MDEAMGSKTSQQPDVGEESTTGQPDLHAGLTVEAILERVDKWIPGDIQELNAMGQIIQAAYNNDSEESVRLACERFLVRYEGLVPGFFKAKFYGHLSACPR